MDEVLEKMQEYKHIVLDLKRKLVEVTNKNINLQTRVGALEQHVAILEQKQLNNQLDLANIPVKDSENIIEIAKFVAKKLCQHTDNIINVKRLEGRKGQPGPLRVTVKNESAQEEWLMSSKKTLIYVKDIIPSQSTENADQRVYVNEALTPHNKKLLWSAKQELKASHKYIWYKKGVIMARKTESEKPVIIRSVEDIQRMKT